MSDLGVKYPYAYFNDNGLSQVTEHRAYPHAALIDPKGIVVWTGHPTSLNKGTIEEHLKGASKFLSYGWGPEFEPVAKAVAKREFAKAIAEVDKLAAKDVADAAAVREGVLGLLDVEVKALTAALDAGDCLEAHTRAASLDGKLKGLTQEKTGTDVLKRLTTDKTLKEILEGQKKLAKLAEGELRKEKEIQAAIRSAEQLAKKYEGTIVATEAQAFISRLQAALKEK